MHFHSVFFHTEYPDSESIDIVSSGFMAESSRSWTAALPFIVKIDNKIYK